MPDLVSVIDSPLCELERAYTLDLVSDGHASLLGGGPYARGTKRLFTVDWTHGRDVSGVEQSLVESIMATAAIHPDKPIMVLAGFLSLLVNTDIPGLVADLSSRVGNPLITVKQDSLDDDWIDGIAATQAAVRAAMPVSGGDPGRPVFEGYAFLRQSGDEWGDVAELAAFARSVGLPDPIWPFNGITSFRTPSHPSAPRIRFPYAPATGDGRAVDVPLPIGLDDTARFIRVLADIAGNPAAGEELIERETMRVIRILIPRITKSFAGLGAVVVADPARARGLVLALRDLGIFTPLVIALRRSGMGEEDLAACRGPGTTVMVNPTQHDVEEKFHEVASNGQATLMIGSGLTRDAARNAGLSVIEAAYPCVAETFAAMTPLMGFNGLLHLADRIDSALLR